MVRRREPDANSRWSFQNGLHRPTLLLVILCVLAENTVASQIERTTNSSRHLCKTLKSQVAAFNASATDYRRCVDMTSSQKAWTEGIADSTRSSNHFNATFQATKSILEFLQKYAPKPEVAKLFCSVVFDCDVGRESHPRRLLDRDAVCLELRVILSLSQPLLLNDLGELHPWVSLAESTLCERRNFSQCFVRSMSGDFPTAVYSCPHPLQRTYKPSRRSRSLKELLDLLETNYLSMPTNLTDAETFSLYPCGDHCNIVGSSTRRTLIVFWTRFSGVVQMLLALVVLAASFRIGIREMLRYPNRLQLYLMCAVLIFAQFLWPHILQPITGHDIGCHGDHTEKLSVDLMSDSACVYSFALGVFGGMMFQLITLFVAVAWWQLVMKLQIKDRWYVIDPSGKVEFVWMSVSLAWTIVVIVYLAGKESSLETQGSLNFCVSTDSSARWMVFAPQVLFLAIALCILCDGLRRLQVIFVKSKKLRIRASIMHRRSSDRTMEIMIRRIRSHVIGLVLIGVVEVAFLFIDDAKAEADRAEREKRAFLKCMIAFCGDATKCQAVVPVLATKTVVITFFFSSFSLVLALLLCAWAFQPYVWFRDPTFLYRKRRHLRRSVLSFRSRFAYSLRRQNTLPQSTSSKYIDSAHKLTEINVQVKVIEIFPSTRLNSASTVEGNPRIVSDVIVCEPINDNGPLPASRDSSFSSDDFNSSPDLPDDCSFASTSV